MGSLQGWFLLGTQESADIGPECPNKGGHVSASCFPHCTSRGVMNSPVHSPTEGGGGTSMGQGIRYW